VPQETVRKISKNYIIMGSGGGTRLPKPSYAERFGGQAWAKRRYVAHFISKLTDADGEQQETQHWLGRAHECEYITTEEKTNLIARYEEVGKMLQSMIDKADSFCGPHS
jgi:hypothetical protein